MPATRLPAFTVPLTPSHASGVRLTRLARCISLAGVLVLGLAAAPARGQDATPARTVELTAGMHLIHAELADDYGTRLRGLMFRKSLAPNHGMLFVFDSTEAHCMWMRNTLLPLSVAFIGNDGAIVNVEEMKAQTDDTHCARTPVHYALEMDAGWFAKHGLRGGSVIAGITKYGPR